ISVTANVAPRLCAEFQEHTLAGRYDAARELQDRLLDLHLALFCSPSPGPAKYALSRLSDMSGEVRLPVTSPGPEARARVDAAMARAGLEFLR
ncbi:MAG: dihydrodipicolinate synthase family protein, partial [Caulobacterales bacterium]|nr:dihydrodipicolinate synthase family protein [Caulobacterales bacterium]